MMLRCFFLFTVAFACVSARADETNATPNSKKAISNINKASSLIGMEVKNQNNERLGEMKDLAIELSSERVVYAILAAGGFLGIGEKLLALPPMSLNPAEDQKSLLLEADKEALRSAPGFALDNWNRMKDPEFAGEVYAFYKEEPALNGLEIREAAGADNTTEAKSDEKKETPGAQEIAPAATTLVRASELIGMSVKNAQGEKIGDIRDFAVDLHSGKLIYAVLSAGGFLGIGDKMFAVPPEAFTRSSKDTALILNVTKEVLRSAATFDPNNWPEKADERFALKTYKYHGQSSTGPQGVKEPSGADKPHEKEKP